MDKVLPTPNALPASKYRYLFYPDEIHLLPNNLKALWSERHKEHMAGVPSSLFKEPFIRNSAETDDESIHDFFERRFGPSIANHFASALVHGIYAGDSRQLSMRSCFPALWDMEHRYGSLLLGMYRHGYSQHAKGDKALADNFKSQIEDKRRLKLLEDSALWTMQGGMAALPAMLERKLTMAPNVTILRNTELSSIESTVDGVAVRFLMNFGTLTYSTHSYTSRTVKPYKPAPSSLPSASTPSRSSPQLSSRSTLFHPSLSKSSTSSSLAILNASPVSVSSTLPRSPTTTTLVEL
jgi:protoporphyrinogen oxidase